MEGILVPRAETVLEAYKLVRRFVPTAMKQRRVIPTNLDHEDVVQEIMASTVLPALSKFNPAKASLSTFLYRKVMDRAYWLSLYESRKGITVIGVRTKAPGMFYLEFPVLDSSLDDDSKEDDACVWPKTIVAEHERHRFLAYDNPPEGLEITGDDAWCDRYDAIAEGDSNA
jgi:DNA-directed RNA polymerase specialized sigma24 family protein